MKGFRKYFTTSLAVILLISMFLAGCGPSTTAPSTSSDPVEQPAGSENNAIPEEPEVGQEVDDKKTLTIAVSADIAGWDPATSIYWLANEVIANTHDTLVDFGPATDSSGRPVRDISNIIPNLAESFEEKDGMEFTFKIREDAKFNNGDPVTAQAVKDSFVRSLGIPGLTSFLLADVAFIKSGDQIEVVDEYVVKFTLPQPNPMFMKIVQEINMGIVNVAEIQANGTTEEEQNNWAAAHTTGSGPYMVERYEAGVELVLTINPYYWGDVPYYTNVVYKIVPDVQNRLLLLRNGDVDVVYEAPLKDIETLKADPNIQTFTTPTFGTLFWWVGGNAEPWSKKELRQAIAYAIPYDSIVDDITYGYAIQATSWMPVGLEGHIDASPYKYDLDKAKELLVEAGYPNGEGLPTITFYSKQGVPEEEQVAVFIQSELSKIGINMEIQPIALAAHSEKLASHEKGLFSFNYWIPYVPDPIYSLYWNFLTTESGCCNYGSYSNQRVDELITQGLTELDKETYISILEEIQTIVAEDPPSIPLYHPSWNIAMLNNVKGYSYYPDTLIRFSQFYE